MPLAAGDQLGPYEVISLIGEGGMGEVYKARDTRLDRSVALKVSKDDFTDRFDREARAVAALNHPNICQLYDVGPNYLVMEFIDGTPLEGPLPLEKVVEYARQILDALTAAHSKRITHRDLKPANILVTRQGIKLLDFGLAKQQESVVADADATIKALTVRGAILGTLQYMAPEQLHGKEADARSDIFSFGCVLYEMLSGKRAFSGESAASIIGAILHQQPEPIQVDAPLERLIKRCLEKDPDDRFQTARDLKYNIALAVEPAPAPARPSPKKKAWPYVAAAAAMGVALLVLAIRPTPMPDVVQFQIPLIDTGSWRPSFAISPNGKLLATILSTKDARRQLFLRRLDSSESTPLTGTSGTNYFEWSPDSSEIAFSGDGKVRRLNLATGVIQDVAVLPRSAALRWSSTGVFLFSSTDGSGPLLTLPVSGGTPSAATVLDTSKGETAHRLPSLCPDGKHFLYQVLYKDGRKSMKAGLLGSLQDQIAPDTSAQSFCAGTPGMFGGKTYLLQVRDKTLMARTFDPGSGKQGPDVWVVARNPSLSGGAAHLSWSRTGILAYRTLQSGAGKLTWHDRSGRAIQVLPSASVGANPALSADGQHLASVTNTGENFGIGITDLSRNSTMPLMTQEGASLPVWSPDGSRIAFMRPGELYEADTRGSGAIRMIAAIPGWPQQYTADGKRLLYVDYSTNELRTLAVEGDPKPVTVAPAGPTYFPASFSPDERFVTYTSTETGRPEVYVRAVPPGIGKWLISTNGGGMSFWRGDGKELFYVNTDLQMMAVDIQLSPVFRAGVPRPLFQTHIAGINNGRNNYVVSKDGQKFLIYTPPEEAETAIHVILNWHTLLRKSGQTE